MIGHLCVVLSATTGDLGEHLDLDHRGHENMDNLSSHVLYHNEMAK